MLAVRILYVQGEGGLVQMLAVFFLRGALVLGACMPPRARRTRVASDLFFVHVEGTPLPFLTLRAT